ncbi:MAG: hypothetical protein IGNPGNKH_00087 [Sodalis sp. Ffu]|nr:MAG: hypothetical protein IGNPGNKH_00087 [Sodalis sp. Ffu]
MWDFYNSIRRVDCLLSVVFVRIWLGFVPAPWCRTLDVGVIKTSPFSMVHRERNRTHFGYNLRESVRSVMIAPSIRK